MSLREKFLGLSLASSRKSYYPQLKIQLEMARENERRLQLLIDNLPARISFVDHQERFVLVNRMYERQFGVKRHQIVGHSVRAVLGEENYALVKSQIRDALRGNTVHFESLFTIAAGESQWLDVTFIPDRNPEGGTNGFYVLAIDVTEKKRVEDSLHNKDRLLKEIGRIVKIGGWAFDPATGQGTWTDEVAQIFDLGPEDEHDVAKGLSYFHGEHRRKIENAIKAAADHGRSWDLELQIVSARGILKWIRTIGQPVVENGRVVRVRGSFQDITDRVMTEQAVQISEERFRVLVDSAPDPIFVQTGGFFAYTNSAAVRLFGAADRDELIGTPVIERFHPHCRDRFEERLAALIERNIPAPSRHEVCLRMDGATVDVEASAISMNYEGSNGALVFARDISDRIKAEEEQRRLQEQLHQAQKMESIGRLAGGVAHDFNNFLSVIIGYTELAMLSQKPGADFHKNLQEVLKAATRSKEVTRQLLTFARKEAIVPDVLDLNKMVESMLKMIRRLIGENIELDWRPSASLRPVRMDPSQLDQILANLCVNARDAIVDVGRITIATNTETIDEEACRRHAHLAPGCFVTLSVSDDGCGMDQETIKQIFEPFFTTKASGRGTGLGLSTVYGIVKQNNGLIHVDSEPGKGTTFKIFLPGHEGRAAASQKAAEVVLPKGRGETVLVVEDEVSILELTDKMLKRYGYNVLLAASPADALHIVRTHNEEISLLITDVIMPEMNGRQLVDEIKSVLPGIKHLFMSGYPADVIDHSGVLKDGLHFIQKPFSPKDLIAKIDGVLCAKPS